MGSRILNIELIINRMFWIDKIEDVTEKNKKLIVFCIKKKLFDWNYFLLIVNLFF